VSVRTSSPYYQDSGRIPFASRLSYTARKRIFAFFMQVMKPSREARVLDVGVTVDAAFRESNFFEQFYPYKEQIVCIGAENGAHLEQQYPGIRFLQVVPGQPLPFPDRNFDFVFSNAVVEHTGGGQSQRAFISEVCRVGRRVFVATPNRWFPVEHHTGVPLLHYLPPLLYRRLLRHTPLEYWSREEHLNLLTARSLRALFADGYPVAVRRIGVGLGAFMSNLVAFTAEPERGSR
jgi:methyltransferase family protein